MRGVLGETVRLLVSNLHLFTLISLTVWRPGHVARHYIEFFEAGNDASLESFRLGLMTGLKGEGGVLVAVGG